MGRPRRADPVAQSFRFIRHSRIRRTSHVASAVNTFAMRLAKTETMRPSKSIGGPFSFSGCIGAQRAPQSMGPYAVVKVLSWRVGPALGASPLSGACRSALPFDGFDIALFR